MNHRLEPLCWLPPPTGTPWIGPPKEQSRYEIKRANGTVVTLDLPLFWNEPAWCQTDPEVADMVAVALAYEGVMVSALMKDLTGPDQPAQFFEQLGEESTTNQIDRPYLSRMVPYRPERYGLGVDDFDGARIIDVRLHVCPDHSGRFAYSADQLDRWEGKPDGEPPAGGSWAPAATFPPDVVSIEHLAVKFDQLRALSPGAAIFVSITPHRMDAEIPRLLATKPDGIILDLSELPLDGLELGHLTRHARRLLNATGAPGIPLWIVPGPITADDAVKLVVLGATGIAIDHWCRDLIEDVKESVRESPAARLGQHHQRDLIFPVIRETVRESLELQIERFKGLLHRMRCLPANQRLGSLDRQWARTFEVPWVSIGRMQNKTSPSQPTEDS